MGTAEDKLEIMELMARYAYCSDCGDAVGFADVFTDDGIVDLVASAERRITLKGREEILEFMGRSAERQTEAQLRHFMGCPMFAELTPERAMTRTYCNVRRVAREPGKTAPPGPTGIYYDEIVRTLEGWRFKSRKFIADPLQQPK